MTEIYRHIYCKHNCYYITKKIGSSTVYFGSYRKLTDALLERDLLVASDWNVEVAVEMEESYCYVEELLPPFHRRMESNLKEGMEVLV